MASKPSSAPQNTSDWSSRDFDRFLQTVVHDARSLLRKSQTSAQRLQLQSEGNPESDPSPLLAEVIRANRSLDLFLSRLADYAMAGEPDVAQPVPLRMAVRGAIAATAGKAGVEVPVQFDTGAEGIRVSPTLQTILTELLDNALKYHRAESAVVSMDVEVSEREIRVNVRDQGIGIDARFLDRIFHPLVRLHAQDQFPGFGLGLAISLRVAESLGAKIEIRNGAEHGCVASVILPRDTTPLPHSEPRRS